jgi:putative aldouronate transport system permease protein
MLERPVSLASMTKWQLLLREIRKNKSVYAFVIPGLLLVILFRYYPLYFLQIAFRNYRPTRALSLSEWEGLRYFEQLVTSPGFWRAFRNTLIISAYRVAAGFPVPIIFALLLNEMRARTFKRFTQTIIYLPHFISWVVIASILINLTSVQGGLFNEIRALFGLEARMYMADKSTFRGILVLSGIWKEAGWGTIIYLATISRINPELYESATIDGANRLQGMLYITLPGISEVIVILLVLNIGNFIYAGFEQILVMQNNYVLEVSDVLSTYVYRTGLLNNRYSYASAAGLFRSVIATVLVVGANMTARRFGKQGII